MISKRKLHIAGMKGLPGRYGGFESFGELLSVHLAQKNIEVSAAVEEVTERDKDWSTEFGIRLVPLGVSKRENPVEFYLRGVRSCQSADVVLVLGVGGGLSLFLNLLSGWYRPRPRTVVNLDGIEWKRKSHTWLNRVGMRFLGYLSALAADAVVLDSPELPKDYDPVLKFLIRDKYQAIPYPSRFELFIPSPMIDTPYSPTTKFVLVVSRFVDENSIDLILSTSEKIEELGLEIWFIGNRKGTKWQNVDEFNNIRFLGPIFELDQLYYLFRRCCCYVHGHTVGGTNPVLVEAMSIGANIFAFDNHFNRWVAGNGAKYFKTSDDLLCLFEGLTGNVEINNFFLERYRANFSISIVSDAYTSMLWPNDG